MYTDMNKPLNDRMYFPMLVSNNGGAEAITHEEDQRLWEKLFSIPKLKQDIITDGQVPEKIAELQKRIQLVDAFVGVVSLHIRKIFFEEMTLAEAETSLKNALVASGDDASKAQFIVQFIQKEILTIKPKPVVEETTEDFVAQPKAAIEKMPLLQALSKYENLGNQLITNERIKIKSQPEPVRPSLLYWIKYYRDELGIGHHSTVDRGNFLFRSENGKRLTAPERERVNLVLKSVEENYPVDIDTERSEIIFPAFVEPTPRPQPIPQSAPTPVTAPVTPRPKPAFNFGQGGMISGAEVKKSVASTPTPGNLSFTSKHVFPAEKPAAPAPTVNPRPGAQAPRPMTQSPQPPTNPFRINPVSLGKVKDEE